LEGRTVTFWCTDVPLQAEEFTPVCLRNTTAVCNNNGIWELAFDSQERCSVSSAPGKIVINVIIIYLLVIQRK
jgi:hypothetical protein